MTFVVLAAVGLVAGALGGMLGIGGSVIFIPAMGELLGRGRNDLFLVWAATALICNVFVGGGAALGHYRNRRVIPRVVKMIIPLGVAGAVVGVLAANVIPPRYLWLIFGVVVGYMIYRQVGKLFSKSEPDALRHGDSLEGIHTSWPRVSLVAGPTGFLAGMLGVGGGIYSVPSQQLILDMPQKNAIANSSTTMVVFCAIAAVVRNLTLVPPEGITRLDPLILAAVLVPTALVGGFFGGHITHKLPDRLVRAIFVGFLLWTAYKCFIPKGRILEFFSGA
jgi:uncharacterized membrane protein YfcA